MAPQGCDDGRGGFAGEERVVRGHRPGGCEGVGAVPEHEAGIVCVAGRGRDAEVPQHGIRLPAAEELDLGGIFVDPSTEESTGSTRPQGPGREELLVYASVTKRL